MPFAAFFYNEIEDVSGVFSTNRKIRPRLDSSSWLGVEFVALFAGMQITDVPLTQYAILRRVKMLVSEEYSNP